MKLKLKKVAPLQAGKILGALYGLISLIFVPFFVIGMTAASLAPASSGNTAPLPLMMGMGLGFIIFLPIMYAVMGFLGGVICAWIYNLLAKWIGGFEVEFEQEAPPPVV